MNWVSLVFPTGISIQQTGHQPIHIIQAAQETANFISRKNKGQASRLFRLVYISHTVKISPQHLAVQKNQGISA